MSSGFSFAMDNSANRLVRLGLQQFAAHSPNVDDRSLQTAHADTMSGDEFQILEALLVAQSHGLRRVAIELLRD